MHLFQSCISRFYISVLTAFCAEERVKECNCSDGNLKISKRKGMVNRNPSTRDYLQSTANTRLMSRWTVSHR